MKKRNKIIEIVEDGGYKSKYIDGDLVIDPTLDTKYIQFWLKRCKDTETPYCLGKYDNGTLGIFTKSGVINTRMRYKNNKESENEQ